MAHQQIQALRERMQQSIIGQQTVVERIIIGLLANGMTLMGVHPYWQEVARGLIVLFAVLISVLQKPIRK